MWGWINASFHNRDDPTSIVAAAIGRAFDSRLTQPCPCEFFVVGKEEGSVTVVW